MKILKKNVFELKRIISKQSILKFHYLVIEFKTKFWENNSQIGFLQRIKNSNSVQM